MTQTTITLTVEPREVTGKAVKHLRKAGVIPAVIHDHGKESVHVQGDYVAFTKAYKQAGKHHAIELTSGANKYVAMIKSADFEPRKNMLTHLVFNAVNRDEKIEAEIPVHAKYDEGNDASPAERAGYMVISNVSTVEVEAIASNLPDALYYDAEKLVEVGDHVTVADLVLPTGVIMKTEADHTIATVFEPSAVAAANDATGGDDVDASGNESTEAVAITEEAAPVEEPVK